MDARRVVPQGTQLKLDRAVTEADHSAPDEYSFHSEGDRVVRRTSHQTGVTESSVPWLPGAPDDDPASAFDWSWLRLDTPPVASSQTSLVRVGDLFSGCGQMSVGILEACRALGRRGEVALALDIDQRARELCRRQFPGATIEGSPIEKLVGGRLGAKVRDSERDLVRRVGHLDVLVGGPPCQGHSDLNNHTRRKDSRNALGFRLVRFAELTEPTHVVVENVRGIVHDRGHVFQRMRDALDKLGYRTTVGVIRAEDLGVPQKRRRMFLVGTRAPGCDPALAVEHERRTPRSVDWAIDDLECINPRDDFDRAPVATARNQRRIDILFEEGAYDLADRHRPPCHRRGGHSYKSIYGRLRGDRPSQTITTGFRCMGQGRYVHPRKRRTITPHEAARLQFIPDFVDFSGLPSTAVARLIGNAVPPKMAYTILLSLLSGET